jgi:hypothetical protein
VGSPNGLLDWQQAIVTVRWSPTIMLPEALMASQDDAADWYLSFGAIVSRQPPQAWYFDEPRDRRSPRREVRF